jgi:hypothetical protein
MLRRWLTESQEEFLAAIDGLTAEQWNWRPAPDRWSVGDVAEHIVLAEALLFGAVRKALASPANPDWEAQTKGKTALIERIMAPRVGRAQSPEPILPKGSMTPDQARETFLRQRVRITKFADQAEQAPLQQHTLDHPFPVFGTLNAYQWMIYLPLHTMRHDKQIAEVKATAGYPR